jgi:hypothetical protein
MKYFLSTLLILGLINLSCCKKVDDEHAEIGAIDFNFDWQFKLTDTLNPDRNWRNIRLPHDWSVEASFDSLKGEGATAYLPGGIGWYKKEFPLFLEDDKQAFIVFDGVYNNAEISINNKKLGFHPYGYSPFFFNISDQLYGSLDNNILEVKVDRTRYADSRWYSGSGIYRNVELVVKNKLHIPIWGTFVTTPQVSKEEATVITAVKINNAYDKDQEFNLVTEIIDPNGQKVATQKSNLTLDGGESIEKQVALKVKNPFFWDIDDPKMYMAITSIKLGKIEIERVETPFGIRTIHFDANTGFFLNGKNMKIKGVCLHHDAGLVGAAVPKGVWRRRLQKLKDGGCNAIRISHNPGSQEFLDLCDEMGFLVQDEFFDEWDNPKDKRKNMNEQSVDYITRGYTEHFQEWAEKDLKNTVLAHRNHPSIIQWSIGNEIEWTYPRNGEATGFFNNMHWSGNYFWELPPNSPEQIKEQMKVLPKGKYDIGETAKKLANWTREMDTTRYIIANAILPSSSYESGYIDALDMVGFSYRRVIYDYGHENYPGKPIMGTENLGQWHEWKAVMDRPFISGTYLWTGIDYMGESNGGWPKKGTSSGLLDLAGFEKPAYHMFNSLWNETAEIYLATQTLDKSIFEINGSGNVVERKPGAWKQALWGWHDVNEHWDYNANETIIAEVYSNCDEVELFLNAKSLGVKRLIDFEDHIFKWAIPYEQGTLMAKGSKDGKLVETKFVSTTQAVAITLKTDKEELVANGYEVAHIVAQVVDQNGNPVKSEDHEITLNVEGEVRILGADNGAIDNVQDFQTNKTETSKGRCLFILQSEKKPSEIRLKAVSGDLISNKIAISIKPSK